jgi:hypothetical protein
MGSGWSFAKAAERVGGQILYFNIPKMLKYKI